MSFSKRVGLEPASDLKSRIKSLCQEAGFDVLDASMHLHREESMQESARIIHVWAREPGWTRQVPEVAVGTDWEKHADYQVEIRAIIGADGTFGGSVKVQCSATDQAMEMWSPTLRNNDVLLMDLPPFLRRVVDQQRQVILARKAGEKGPWTFGDMVWKDPTPWPSGEDP